ncbi:MAG: trypsin-like serine protease [Colwellia sp.]|nr:trypsin-like serine protease [Colwellia sp.]
MQHYLKIAIISASLCAAFISNSSLAKSSELIPIKTKIVGGGEVPDEDKWPWMSALVSTTNEISTTLTVNNINYQSQAFSYGVAGNATGNTVDCGIGDEPCSNVTNKICLIERGDIDFSLKVENCQAGGGIGAIIYNNVDGAISGTLGEDFAGSIPVVSITKADGATLQSNIGASASLTVIEGIATAQSLTCGASFLGDKWLLTASHCVDGISPQQLKVNVGEYDLSNGAENAKAIKRIYMHADYQLGVELDNDIALIELVNSIDNPAITLVDLAATEQFSIDNRPVTVVGWGGREGFEPDGGPTSDFPDVLHQVDLQLLTNEDCKNIVAQSSTDAFEGTFTANDIDITDAMICAYIPDGGKGSCQGDSGGPLIINTNEGWQQIGIVSWGIGCAAQGFPGVYTRTAVFSDWIDEITQGIAIDQTVYFTIQAINKAQSATLEVVNNSLLDANITFKINGDANFTIANDDCNNIAAGATCLLQVNYDAAEVGKHSANIDITSDNDEIATSSTKISAQTIALANAIKTQLSSSDDALTWYSGGSDNNSAWQLDNTEAAIVSGSISDGEQSIVMVTVAGEGELSFEWSVSSEENTEEPEEPYDALYLYVDGELIKFISGDIPYQSESVTFTAGEHNITWVYEKDPFGSEGDDNAHLRNIVYTPLGGVPATPPAPTPTNPKARSSGGSIAWLSLLFTAVISLRRK